MTDPAVEAVMRVNRRHFNVGIGCRCGWQPKRKGVGVLWMEELDEHVACEVVAALDPVMRKTKAEAWDEAVGEAHGLGWLHDWALSDGIARNPYRIEADRG